MCTYKSNGSTNEKGFVRCTNFFHKSECVPLALTSFPVNVNNSHNASISPFNLWIYLKNVYFIFVFGDFNEVFYYTYGNILTA